MFKLSDKSRKRLRSIFRGLGVTAVSLVFQACPGPYMSDEVGIYGSVQSKKTGAPILGIKVSTIENDAHTYTDENGDFSMYLPIQDKYTVKFEDIDGPENGGSFQQRTEPLSFTESTFRKVDIALESDEE